MNDHSNSEGSIIDEIHRVRAQISDRFHGDLKAICDDARRRQAESDRTAVARPPRRPAPQPAPARKAG